MFTVVAGFYVSRYAAAGKQNIIERHFTVSPLSKKMKVPTDNITFSTSYCRHKQMPKKT